MCLLNTACKAGDLQKIKFLGQIGGVNYLEWAMRADNVALMVVFYLLLLTDACKCLDTFCTLTMCVTTVKLAHHILFQVISVL